MGENAAQLSITRPKGFYQDAIRRYKVMLDGEVIGKIKAGDTRTYDVTPGPHTVVASLDGVRSNALDVVCETGTITRLEIGPSRPTGPRKIFAEKPWMEIRHVV